MTWTLQQLQSAGFSLVEGQGERIQWWRGPDPVTTGLSPTGPFTQGLKVDVVWDSISGRRKIVRSGPVKPQLVALATMVVLWDVIQAIPGSVLSAQQKTDLGTALLNALDDD